MRKLLLYLLIVLGALGLGYLARDVKPSYHPTLLSIDTDYIIAYQDESKFDIILFTNDPTHPLFQMDEVLRIIAMDDSSSILFELHLLEIQFGHREVYLHQTWTRIIFSFTIPFFSEDLYLPDFQLRFELFNQQEYLIKMGKMTLLTTRESLDFDHLSGEKIRGSLQSRLGTIHVGIKNETYQIDSVSLGSLHQINFTHHDDLLSIVIPKEDYLLYNPALLITTEEGKTWIIANFLYVIDHMLLKESGPLINHYALY